MTVTLSRYKVGWKWPLIDWVTETSESMPDPVNSGEGREENHIEIQGSVDNSVEEGDSHTSGGQRK